METDACGICNGNNALATFVSDSSSQVVSFGTLKFMCICVCVHVYNHIHICTYVVI